MYEMDKDGKTVSMVEPKYIFRRIHGESAESFRVLNEIAAAKGGENKVRMTIREQLLKEASSSELSVAQKDCQEDLSTLQSAELRKVRILLPPDGRCFFHGYCAWLDPVAWCAIPRKCDGYPETASIK